jgi:hypothetical protein
VTTPAAFDDIDDGPRHEDEVMAAHQGAPSLAVQDRTHGAGMPAVDNGTGGSAGYGGNC